QDQEVNQYTCVHRCITKPAELRRGVRDSTHLLQFDGPNREKNLRLDRIAASKRKRSSRAKVNIPQEKLTVGPSRTMEQTLNESGHSDTTLSAADSSNETCTGVKRNVDKKGETNKNDDENSI